MELNKFEIEYMIQEKRDEIHKLYKKINSLQEDINQIEKKNLAILREPIENNATLMKIMQLFKEQPRKEDIKSQFKYKDLFELDLKKLKLSNEK